VVRTLPTSQQPDLRLLLDQGFPNPPGFALRSVDVTVEVVHLWNFDRALSEDSTPDWVVYCVAAAAGFDGLVTRDRAQLRQTVEMYVLSRLPAFTVITWKRAIEDPVREWGQLLAYLPEVKKRLSRSDRPNVVLLPAPALTQDNIWRADDRLGIEARARGVANRQVRAEAEAEIRDWLQIMSRDPHEFDQVLGLGSKISTSRPDWPR
jgi:hypothetical protein